MSVDLGRGVRAIQTLRGEGATPYGGFNLGMHVDDDPMRVQGNRDRLATVFGAVPVFANQVHGTRVVTVERSDDQPGDADALLTRTPNVPIGILTADCLPVLFCADETVAVAHAGWRGLAGGVLETVLAHLGDSKSIRVWLGPCIGASAFEVGPEVREIFVGKSHALGTLFTPSARADHFLADLRGIACALLEMHGIRGIEVSTACTYRDQADWYSYRREGVTGRMASCLMRTG